MIRKHVAFYVLGAILLSIGAANAQKVTRVCWGEYEGLQECLVGGKSCVNACGLYGFDQHFKCGSGGHRGFNNPYVCQQVCGKPEGAGCEMRRTQGADGGNCGYSWVRVACVD